MPFRRAERLLRGTLMSAGWARASSRQLRCATGWRGWSLVAALTASSLLLTATADAATVVFADDFSAPAATNSVVTNEYSYWNPSDTAAAKSANWEMGSGTLFAQTGSGWSGRPDTCDNVDRYSQTCNNSAVFRLATKRHDFGDVSLDLDLNSSGLTSTASTPPVAWDGVHLWLRYQSEYNLYYASVNRRDNRVVIKKKCVGGSENGGTYYELGPGEVSAPAWPVGSWQHVGASVQNNSDGSVTLKL